MNWDAIGAIAEMLGASAVFLSLIYLAVQIRGSTNQASAQMFLSVASEQSRVSDAITGDPENLLVWIKMHSGSEFTREEKARVQFLIGRVVQAYLAIQLGYDKGQIDEKFYGDAKEQVNQMLGSEHAKPIVKKQLERAHPNLMSSEMFALLLEQ
jgi:hypothetical protein